MAHCLLTKGTLQCCSLWNLLLQYEDKSGFITVTKGQLHTKSLPLWICQWDKKEKRGFITDSNDVFPSESVPVVWGQERMRVALPQPLRSYVFLWHCAWGGAQAWFCALSSPPTRPHRPSLTGYTTAKHDPQALTHPTAADSCGLEIWSS